MRRQERHLTRKEQDEQIKEIARELNRKFGHDFIDITDEGLRLNPDITEKESPPPKPPWLLSMLGKEYQAGGLFAFPVYSAGIEGTVQHAVKEIGANIFGQVAGYQAQRTTIPALLHSADQRSDGRLNELGQNIKNHPVTQALAWSLRLGHIDGLREFQQQYGFAAFDKIVSGSSSIDSASVYQLETCYEAMSDEMRSWTKNRIPPEQSLALETFFNAQPKALRVPDASPLFAPFTQPIPDHLEPPFNPSAIPQPIHGLLSRFRQKIASTTYERLGYWTGITQEPQGLLPQTRVLFKHSN